MKIKSILFTFFLSVFAVVMMNCSGKKAESTEQKANESTEGAAASEVAAAAEPQFDVNPDFQKQLEAVFSSYVKMKDAFVHSAADKVKAEASETQAALAKVDMSLLEDAAHHDWMTFVAPLESSLKEIQAAADIEAQRKSFSVLSDNLYKSVKAFGLGGKDVYYEFCPMAFDNQGAYWLSDRDQIRNPYFGDAMLTCGKVVEKLK